MLILDLGLGPYADQPLNAWQESFLPMVLQRELAGIKTLDSHSLVIDEQVLSPNRLQAPPDNAPDLRLPLAIAGLVFAALLIALQRVWPIGYALIASLYLLLAGVVGVILLILWLGTAHHSAWANANLLLFNPLAWLLFASVWQARRSVPASRFANIVLVVQLVAALLAIGLHLLPGVAQQNQPWLLFALPCCIALAWSMRRPSGKK
jgi:hypothetical protein